MRGHQGTEPTGICSTEKVVNKSGLTRFNSRELERDTPIKLERAGLEVDSMHLNAFNAFGYY